MATATGYNVIGSNDGVGVGTANLSEAQKLIDRELFLKKLATDVLVYFMDTNVARELVTNRSIDSGKSEAFPVVGNTVAEEITNDGAEISLDSIKSTEREITIDGLTIAKSMITDLDQAMVHYDAKAAHTESIGRSLAKKVDFRVIAEVIAAAGIVDAAAATAYGLKPFAEDIYTQKESIAVLDVTSGVGVYNAMIAANTQYVDQDIVGEPVFMLRPASYFALLNNAANTGLTWVNDPFSQSGKVPLVMGRSVKMSPHFPAYAGGGAGIIGAGDCQGLLFAKECVGVLELLSVSMRTDYLPLRLSNLTVGKMALGYGVLNHGAAITIEVV